MIGNFVILVFYLSCFNVGSVWFLEFYFHVFQMNNIVRAVSDNRAVMSYKTWSLKTETRRDVQPSRPRRHRDISKISRDCSVTVWKHQLVKSVTWQPVSCGSDPLFSSWYIRKSDALHGCSQDLKSRNPRPRRYILKTETLNPQDRDETETFDFSNSRDWDETETFSLQDRRDWDVRGIPKNVSRPPRDRDVQDQAYIPVIGCA